MADSGAESTVSAVVTLPVPLASPHVTIGTRGWLRKANDDAGSSTLLSDSPRSVRTCSNKISVDARALKKKVGKVTCDPAVRAVLSSLLLYITSREAGPPGPPPAQRPESRDGQVSPKPELPDPSRRLTHFQLLRAKFMGTGREHCLKKTREVGRLIFKDKQGPGRSLVTATINKLLDKTREGAGNSARGQEPLCGDKPRWGLPSGKNTVKNILKKFLAAEEKEAEEKRLREKPPAERPKVARGLLPKIMGKKGSVLSKLRERFEQSGCLCSEAGVLLLHTEDRKKKNLQRKKMHRPETRVLCTATLASTCIRMPPARFLACSAEPMPAFSIATVVCGPRSWLSHCAKLKHSDLRRMPPKEAGGPPAAEETVPGGNETPGRELCNGGPSPSLIPQAAVPSLATVPGSAGPECMPEPAPSPASQGEGGDPLPGLEPELSSLEPASPGHAGVLGGDRTGNPQAESATDDTQGAKGTGAGVRPGPTSEGAEEAPQVDLMVCSSEEETEGVMSDSEQDRLFAVQKSFPEPQGPEHIPPLHMPAAQAARCTQPALEPPQITVRLPVVHEMPLLPVTLQRTSDGADQPAPGLGGERAAEDAQALFPAGAESGSASVATVGVSEPVGTAGGPGTPPQRDSQAGLRLAPLQGAASADGDSPEAAQTLEPQTGPPGGQEAPGGSGGSNKLKNRRDNAGPGVSELSYERRQLPASEELPVRGEGTPPHYSTASDTRPGGDGRPAPGSHQAPSPSEGDSMGVPTLLAAPTKEWTRSACVTTGDEQEQHRGAPLAESAQPLLLAEGGASHDLGEDRPASLNEGPKPSIKTPRQGTATEVTKSHTTPAPGNTANPENSTPEQWSALCKGDLSSSPTGLIAEGLGHEPSRHLFLAPSGPLKHRSSSAAEGRIGGDAGRHLPVTSESLTALPREAAGPQPVPDEPGLGVSKEPAADTANATVGSRNTAAEQAGPWGNNAKSPVPTPNYRALQGGGIERPPHHSVDGPPLSFEKPQAKDDEHVVSEKQLPLGAGVSHQFPSVSPTVAEGASQKCPALQAHLLLASHTQAAVLEETEVGERPPAQAGLGGGEEGVSGPVELKGPGQKGVVAPSDQEKIRLGERPRPQAGLEGVEEGVSGPVGLKGPGQKGVVAPSDQEKIRLGERPRPQAGLEGVEEGVSGPVGLKGPGQKGVVAPSDQGNIRLGERPRPQAGLLLASHTQAAVLEETEVGERPWAEAQAGLAGGEEAVSGPVGLKGPGQKGVVAPSDQGKIGLGERPRPQAGLLLASHTQAAVLEETEVGERPLAQAGLGGVEEGVSGPVELKGPGQKGVAPSDQEKIRLGERPRPQAGLLLASHTQAAVLEETEVGERPLAQAGLGGVEEGVSGPVELKGPGQKGVAPSDQEKIRLGERPRPQAGLEGVEEGVSGPVGLKGPGQKGVPPSHQKTALGDTEEAQTQPWDGTEGGDTVTPEVETPCRHAEKGPELPPGQWVPTAQDPSGQHGIHTEERQGRPAQAQAGRMAPQNLGQPTGNSTAVAPTTGAGGKSQRPAPTGGQGAPGVPQKEGEHHPEVAESQTASRPEPAQGSQMPAPAPGDCQTPGAPGREGRPDISGSGRGTPGLAHQRRSSHFAKYKAQSFSDQRSFDSFRSKIIRAKDTFELPK